MVKKGYLGVYLPLELKLKLEEMAKKEQRTLSNFVAVFLERELNKNEK